METYDLSLSHLEALYLREELNWAANNHREIAKKERDVAVPGFSGHIKIAEWHEDKARVCEELAYRVSQILGD